MYGIQPEPGHTKVFKSTALVCKEMQKRIENFISQAAKDILNGFNLGNASLVFIPTNGNVINFKYVKSRELSTSEKGDTAANNLT